jgi:hypothetical protein
MLARQARQAGTLPLEPLHCPFCEGFFQDRVSQAICPGWFGTTILLISASVVARMTDVILSQKKKSPSHTQKRAGGVAQGIGPDFKPQYCKPPPQKKDQPNKKKNLVLTKKEIDVAKIIFLYFLNSIPCACIILTIKSYI